MRMWMVNPVIMCWRHLSGEHVECHMTVGSIKEKKSMGGYIKNNLLEIESLSARHNALVSELSRRMANDGRKYNHQSPLVEIPDIRHLSEYVQTYRVDRRKSLADLIHRCKECHKRFMHYSNYKIDPLNAFYCFESIAKYSVLCSK